MGDDAQRDTSRREFLKSTGWAAAGSTFLAAMSPRLYAGGDETIRVALVGCGGRGSGAAANAMASRIVWSEATRVCWRRLRSQR